MSNKRSSKHKSLSTGRPPLSRKPKSNLSSKATRNIIRRHHNLLKAHASALKTGDKGAVTTISEQLTQDGGLQKYQQASQTGQSTSRGGDTSKILQTWLIDNNILSRALDSMSPKLGILEIGCLSPNNAISRCKEVEVIRTDLHSTHPSILKEDFMERPIPSSIPGQKFDVISLSLVLNFVPSPEDRGAMLLRTTQFLNQDGTKSQVLPALFLTLPLPCVMNSRYLTIERFKDMMSALGYSLTHSKSSAKIFYSLWCFDPSQIQKKEFPKEEVYPGKERNNFCIVLKG